MKNEQQNADSPTLVTACCMCGRIRKGNLWMRPAVGPDEPVSHTYCPECYAHETRRLFGSETKAAFALQAS
jgi:hypothetical protein